MNKDQFAAYMAGVADSDGSFTIAKRHPDNFRPNYSPLFQLTWVKTPAALKVFDRLIEIYGGSYMEVKGNRAFSYPNGRPYIKYCLSTKPIAHFIQDILPFLVLKRKQARLALRLRKFTRWHSKGHPKSDKHAAFEHKVYLLNRKFNDKGRPEKCAL